MSENEQNNAENQNNTDGQIPAEDTKAFKFEWTNEEKPDEAVGTSSDVTADEAIGEAVGQSTYEASDPQAMEKSDVPIRNKRNGALLAASVISACSILLLIAFAMSLMLGIFPISGREVVLVGVSELGTVPPEAEASSELIEESLHSVVLITPETITGFGTASGVILSSDGYILTNYHVIENAVNLYVKLYGEDVAVKAEVIGYHVLDDVAVIKIDRTGLRAATFARSEDLRAGDRVYAIGNPKSSEFSWTVTRGIISSPYRELKAYNKENVLEYKTVVVQTDAAVNNGNSGGPLINMRGEVVGIVTFKRADGSGLGFALPSSGVLIDAVSIIEKGHADNVLSGITLPRPLLGITGVGVIAKTYYKSLETDGQSAIEIIDKEGAESDPKNTFYAAVSGVYISALSRGSDAEKLLKQGDIVTEINGIGISSIYGVMNIINEHNGGDKVTVKYYRDGSYNTAELTLMSGEAAE